VYLFATAPLGDAERAVIGWRGREGIYTAHEMLESYRLTDDPATFAFIEAAFRDRFPMLRHLPVTHRRGGPIAFALDFQPAEGAILVVRAGPLEIWRLMTFCPASVS
jgi:hypothetical protein